MPHVMHCTAIALDPFICATARNACHIYENVTFQLWICHVTRMNTSRHTRHSDCPCSLSATMGELSVLLQWHAADPPSDLEIARNDKVCVWVCVYIYVHICIPVYECVWIWIYVYIHVYWCIYLRILIHTCAVPHAYVCHVAWLIHTCAMTHSYVCYDSSTRMTLSHRCVARTKPTATPSSTTPRLLLSCFSQSGTKISIQETHQLI